MQKKFKGILLYVKIHKENDLLVKFLTNKDQLISGIVYGGQSKKKKNLFQIGFFLEFEINFKLNRPPSINAELSKPYISNIINDKYKINCIICITSLINICIIEGQKVNNIYYIVESFLILIHSNKKWFNEFCIFLFELLKVIGYEISFIENLNNKYFDLENLEFTSTNKKNSIEFPYMLLDKKNYKIKKLEVIKFFKIFETVFGRHHLSNFNLDLPNQYYLFKNLIIENL